MQTKLALGAVALAAAIIGGSSANAEEILWTLQDATFNDGATASGHFKYDTTTGHYFDVDLTTTTTSTLQGNTYTAFFPGSTPRDWGFAAVLSPSATAAGDPLLDINTSTDFTSPGTVNLGIPPGFSNFLVAEGTLAPGGGGYFPVRDLSGLAVGVAVPAPEPATWAMLLASLLGMGAMLRAARRRANTTA